MTRATTTANDSSLTLGYREADGPGGWLPAAALSLTVSLLIVAPFFWLGSASGHDFEFHISSWLDVAGQWKEGIVFPRWTEWANHGFGEPRFIFYPPLSWLLAPALSFFVPWTYVPVAFIVLVQTFAGLSAFTLARRLLPVNGAIFAGVCYAANPNALLIIYMRSDFAELLASAFFPVLFLAVLELGGLLARGTIPLTRAGVRFAAIFAAVWLSNAPAGVLATYSVALLFAWAAFAEKSWKPVARGSAGMAWGFGLAGCYLVPAAYEQRWVNIGQVLSSGLLPSQNFLYTAINDPEHTLFNWIASTAAVILIVMTGLAALAVYRSDARTSPSSDKAKTWGAALLLGGVATFMMLRASSCLWELLPKLRFVQFPWRWMSILAIPFAYFLGGAVGRGRFRWLWTGMVSAIFLTTGIFFVRHTWWDADDVRTLEAGVKQASGFDGADEYDPIADDHYNLPPKAPEARLLALQNSPPDPVPAHIWIDRWTAEERIVRVESRDQAKLALRVLNYPAWRIEVNGSPARPEPAGDTNQMILDLPAGQSRVRLYFARTRDRTFGAILSLASVLAALPVLLPIRRPARARQATCR
jgi:hypothetical protein